MIFLPKGASIFGSLVTGSSRRLNPKPSKGYRTLSDSRHAAGNMIFLPKGASIIDVSPLNHEDKHAWAFFMAADYRVLRFNPIRIPLQRPVPMVHKLRAYRQWHQLSPEWRCAPLAASEKNPKP